MGGNKVKPQNEFLKDFIDRNLGNEFFYLIVDGGARNGTKEIPHLHPFSCIFCFEPNPEEFHKLRDSPIKGSFGRGRIVNFPYALVNEDKEVVLNITLRPGASSTLCPDSDYLRHFKEDNFSEMGEIIKQVYVPGIRLDTFMNQNAIKNIDLLKLDTQGNELDILLSGGVVIENIEVIKTEVELVKLYKDQALFHDISKFLYQHGFELINIEWTEPCKRFHARPDLHPDNYRLIWANAVFAHSVYDFQKKRLLPQAMVLGEMGYTDIAIYQIRNSPQLDSGEKLRLENYFVKRCSTGATTLKGKVREFIERLFSVEIKRKVKRNKQVVSMRKNKIPISLLEG